MRINLSLVQPAPEERNVSRKISTLFPKPRKGDMLIIIYRPAGAKEPIMKYFLLTYRLSEANEIIFVSSIYHSPNNCAASQPSNAVFLSLCQRYSPVTPVERITR